MCPESRSIAGRVSFKVHKSHDFFLCSSGKKLGSGNGPFGDIQDRDGYLSVANSDAALGFEGKWAIHPSQIELANQVFTPPADDVQIARKILDAMQQAAAEGKGAVSLDGKMIDAASIRQAQVLVDKADQIASNAA